MQQNPLPFALEPDALVGLNARVRPVLSIGVQLMLPQTTTTAEGVERVLTKT